MKVYIIQNKDGEFASVNFAVAYDGFRKMGWEIVPFSRQDNDRLSDLTSEDVVVGYVEDVNAALSQLGFRSPVEVNYPDELTNFLLNHILHQCLNTITATTIGYPQGAPLQVICRGAPCGYPRSMLDRFLKTI